MPWPQIGATHAQLGHPEKGCEIKGQPSAIWCGYDL